MVNESTCIRRTGEIKSLIDKLDKKIDRIMQNELPHINTALKLLEQRLNHNEQEDAKIEKQTRSLLNRLSDNKGWVGVAIISLIQIIAKLLGLN